MYEVVLTQLEFGIFVKKVRYRMLQKKISVRQLSEMTGYSMASIYGFLSGKNSRFMVAAIAEALEMEVK